jgi:hypothetical protein
LQVPLATGASAPLLHVKAETKTNQLRHKATVLED